MPDTTLPSAPARASADLVGIASGDLAARIDPVGAELRSLTVGGDELLWQGDGLHWDQTAPLLFPIIAGIAGGVARIDGREYPMPGHGFAHRMRFATIAETCQCLILAARDDPDTRRHYPFAFALTASFAVADGTLRVGLEIANRDHRPMPFDLGFHPGFRWPLVPGAAKDEHVVVFDAAEAAPIRRGTGGPITLMPEPQSSPVDGRILHPRDALFQADAIVFDRFHSRSVLFGVPGGRGVRLDFPDSPHFAIWMQPGAEFLCLEPWHGLPGPAGFAGELADKPGIAILPAGAVRTWRFAITPIAAMPRPDGDRP